MKLFLCALALLMALPAAAEELSGKPRVIDGDTIDIAGQRIRLLGIDAPERGQSCKWPEKTVPCGDIAADALTGTVAAQDVRCETRGKDRYGRWIAVCFAGEIDIGQNVVYMGWALAYRKYSTDYVATEEDAREARRGMWRGKFIAPWEWRRGKRLASDTPRADRPCGIKGNIGKGGARIYHLPGGAYYGRTKITKSKGERWFCSEDEARAAGWRRSKR